MTRRISKQPTKHELMTAVWDDLGRPMVGAAELRKIQRSLRAQFGEGAVESPAAIARVLADEGAELRHPEVIEFDARWRHKKIDKEVKRLGGLEAFAVEKPLRLQQAEGFILKLEALRKEIGLAGNAADMQSARKLAVAARQRADSIARDPAHSPAIRNEQAEITEWIAVWLQTPSLFGEWLELRRRSADFREKFSEVDFGVRRQT